MPDLITDFGAKIGGARKDMGKGNILPSDIPAMSAEERAHWVRKDMIWPAPDYEALLASGIPRPVLISLKTLRDSLPDCTSTAIDGHAAPEIQEAYVGYVNELRAGFTGENSKSVAAFRAWLQSPDRTGFALEDRSMRTKDGWALNKFDYRSRADHWSAACEVSSYIEKASQALQPEKIEVPYWESSFRWLRKNKDWPENNAAWQIYARRRDLCVFERGGAWLAGSMCYGVLSLDKEGKEVPVDRIGYSISNTTPRKFATREEATAALQTAIEAKLSARKQDAIAKRKAIKDRAEGAEAAADPTQSAQTGGATERNWIEPGQTVTGPQYLKEFGFRGGEFGHWVDQAERQKVLDLGYNALRDLADITGLPPIALAHGRVLADGSLDKHPLAIGFGSRGKGGLKAAAAHFEDVYNVINLTKPHGAGSLGHEWSHGWDFAAAKLAAELSRKQSGTMRAGITVTHDPDVSSGEDVNRHVNFLSDHKVTVALREGEALSPEEQALVALNDAMHGIAATQSTDQQIHAERARHAQSQTSGYSSWMQGAISNWKANNPNATPERQQWFVDRMAELTKPVFAGEVSYSQLDALAEFLQANLKGEKKQIITQLTVSWPHCVTNAIKRCSDPIIHDSERKSIPSEYAKACRKLDGGKKPYYATRVEMFARAFEAWAQDRLTAEGRTSNFLVRATKSGEAYPQGEERKRTNALVDFAVQKWVAVMRARAPQITEAMALRQACAAMADDPEEAKVTALPTVAGPDNAQQQFGVAAAAQR
jgi:hypothetical protein